MVALQQSASRNSAAVQYARDAAFLWLAPPPLVGLPERLIDERGMPFGPPLSPLTPWRHHLLLGYESPYLTGAPAMRRHLWQALYLCSPRFRAGSPWRFLRFQLRHFFFAAFRFQAASEAFCSWLSAAMAFYPAFAVRKTAPGGAPVARDEAWLVQLMQLGRHAGFSPIETLHLPYAVLWMSIDVTMGTADRSRPKFNRARDKAVGEYLRKKRAAQKL